MATISSIPTVMSDTASLRIPSEYLRDVRVAMGVEVLDSQDAVAYALSLVNESESKGDKATAALRDVDVRSSQHILQREMRLYDELLENTELDTVMVHAPSDQASSPIVQMLEQLVRVLSDRLAEAKGYSPIDMGTVTEIADELRWAASEAIRIEPTLDERRVV